MQHTSCYRKVGAKSGCCPLRRKGHPADECQTMADCITAPSILFTFPGSSVYEYMWIHVHAMSYGVHCLVPYLLIQSLPFSPRPLSPILSSSVLFPLSCLVDSLISSSLIASSLPFHYLLVPSHPFSRLSALASSLVPRPPHPFALVYSLINLLSRPFPLIASDVCNAHLGERGIRRKLEFRDYNRHCPHATRNKLQFSSDSHPCVIVLPQ